MSRWPLFRVAIAGASMEPALAAGEWWIALRTRRVRAGDIVVVSQPEGMGFLTVKRLIRDTGGQYWLEGDNPTVSRDSRHFGAVDADLVAGKLLMRYRPLVRRRRRRR